MPTKTPQIPKYGLHKASGQARVVLNGQTHYLGKHGSAESRQAYERLIAEWHLREQLPRPSGNASESIIVDELVLMYIKYAESYYVKNNTNE